MKWTTTEESYLRDNPSQTDAEIGTVLQRTEDSVRNKRKRIGKNFKKESPKEVPKADDLTILKESRENKTFKKKYEETLIRLDERDKEIETILKLDTGLDIIKIEPKELNNGSESTAVALLSDWHFEETVHPSSVNGLNKFNTEIAKERVIYLFQTIVKFVKIHKEETTINNLILALLGDFISGGIHDDLKEGNEMQTIPAIMEVEKLIASGIKHILENTDVNIIIPCSMGNHSRITEKQRVSTESGNSLELWMYCHLRDVFADNERVKFIINEGYHTYVKVYDYTLRFSHGHAIKYGGGIGGIFIPVFKAISQWNKGKFANLDLFGHFHQMKDGGNFITNGSLIGYNAFAVKIKADYEKPKQAFLLIDKSRFVICTRSILLNGNIKKEL